MILQTYFKHWIPVLGTAEGCPALSQFFYFDPLSEGKPALEARPSAQNPVGKQTTLNNIVNGAPRV